MDIGSVLMEVYVQHSELVQERVTSDTGAEPDAAAILTTLLRDAARAMADLLTDVRGHGVAYCICPHCSGSDESSTVSTLVGVVHVHCSKCGEGDDNPINAVVTMPVISQDQLASSPTAELDGDLAYDSAMDRAKCCGWRDQLSAHALRRADLARRLGVAVELDAEAIADTRKWLADVDDSFTGRFGTLRGTTW